ncbi:hypothetical protein [Nocardia sp. alder85J]|uniref:hypothetical protein n=1 Tax=Nocardia sp. alder85J TaxID=2862949 RepID=UPI001CD264DD|nr:hypothetical protein [Nocardia sp. alder85J]MCX4092892.1 hypothetical protein [Nocardia sp. alder85J]
MTLYETSRTIIGARSGEWATRATRGGSTWRLSWLPETNLTVEQARAGVLLAEILATPRTLTDPAVWDELGRLARQVNTTVPQAFSALLQRAQVRRSS